MPFDSNVAAKYGNNLQQTQRVFRVDPLIEWADRVVPIVPILNKLGLYVPDGANNWRTECPFAFEHPNKDKGFRVHSGKNNAYCYGFHGFLTSSKLVAHAEGISRKDAAYRLLDERGLLKQKSYQEQWRALVSVDYKPSSTGKTEELLTYLQYEVERLPGYKAIEFTDDVRATWVRVIEALDALTDVDDLSVEQLDRWYQWALELITDITTQKESNGKVTPVT